MPRPHAAARRCRAASSRLVARPHPRHEAQAGPERLEDDRLQRTTSIEMLAKIVGIEIEMTSCR